MALERLRHWIGSLIWPRTPIPAVSGERILVRKRKYDGRIKSEWEGTLLPASGDAWLVVLHHPDQHRKRDDTQWERQSPLFLHCLNTAAPLTVLLEYALDGRFRGAKCDAALPAVRDGAEIEFVDLDLDVIVERDLTRRVRDQSTFKRNRKRLGYPESVVAQAEAGIALAHELLATRQFPFGPGLNRELIEA